MLAEIQIEFLVHFSWSIYGRSLKCYLLYSSRENMPYVSEKHRFIYMASPATGSSATLAAFDKWEMGKLYPEKPVRDEEGRVVYAAKHGDYENFVSYGFLKPEWKDFIRICGIRNPFSFHLNQYERAKTRLKQIDDPKSHFSKMSPEQREEKRSRFKEIVGKSFKEFLMQKYENSSESFLHKKFVINADYHIRQEYLNEDLMKLKDKISLPDDFQVEVKGVTAGGPNNREKYVKFYDEELIDFVYKLNKPFFDRFPDYEF